MRISDWSSDVCSSDLFDAAHAPAEHAQTVNHCRVTVRTDVGVGISHCRARGVRRSPDRLRNIFKIHLVADADRKSNTSELQTLMSISYASICLKKKKNRYHHLTSKHKTTITLRNHRNISI